MLRIPWSCFFTFDNSCKSRQKIDFLFNRYDCINLLVNLNLNFKASFFCVELSNNKLLLFRLKQQLKSNINIVNFAQITSIYFMLMIKFEEGKWKIIALSKVLSKNDPEKVVFNFSSCSVLNSDKWLDNVWGFKLFGLIWPKNKHFPKPNSRMLLCRLISRLI